MTEPLILDNTKRSTFRNCKMKYYLQHRKGLQSDYGSTALRYGSTWHSIQEGFHKYIKEHNWHESQTDLIAALSAGLELGKKKWDTETAKKQFNEDYKNFNTAVDAFNAYLTHFATDKDFIEILSTEKKFECPILPKNALEEKLLKRLPPIIFTGKIDLGVRMDNMDWLLDFKTTGWYLDSVVAKANRSPQLIGYTYAGRQVLDYDPVGSLCSFAYIGSSKSKKTGEWGNVRFDFRRVPQIYTDEDIAAWKLSFIDTCIDIMRAEEEDLWSESFDNCYQYGACPYLRLCQQHVPFEDLNTEGFHVAFWDVLSEEE